MTASTRDRLRAGGHTLGLLVAGAGVAALVGGLAEGVLTMLDGGPWRVVPVALGVWTAMMPLFVAASAAGMLIWRSAAARAAIAGLADPQRRPTWLAALSTAGVAMAAALTLLVEGLEVVRPGLNDVTLLVPIAGLMAAMALTATAAAAVVVGPLVRALIARRPPGRWVAWVLAAGALILPALAVWPAASYLTRDMVLRPFWMLLAGVVISLVTIATGRRRAAWLLVLAPGALFAGLSAHAHSPAVRGAVDAHRGLSATLVGLVQGLTDGDGDGVSPYLSGGDCDDTDPSIHPAAVDIPGNRLDEDCDGADAPSTSAVERPLTARPALPPALVGRWNLLLLTVDTLRADRMSIYGHDRDTTPNLARLARRAWVVERAYTPANSTRYALPSLFSGRVVADMDVEHLTHLLRIRPGNALLFERMAAAGWTIEAHLPEQLVRGMWIGLDAGVHRYVGHADATLRGRSIKALNRAAADTLPRLAAGPGPWALWLHYLEPHEPYISQRPIDFGNRPIDRYDGEIAATDRAIGEVLALLDELGQTERTIIVLTSDHGEEFGEHGRKHHGYQLYEESVRIPLLIAAPGGKGRRIATPGLLQDITPTVAHLLDLPPMPDYGARSLAGYGAGVIPDDPQREVHLAAFVGGRWPRLRSTALLRWPLKAIDTRKTGRVFDLVADPGEKADVTGGGPHPLLEALAAEDRRQRLAARQGLARNHMADAPPADLDRRRAGPLARGVTLLGTAISELDLSAARYPQVDVWFAVSGEKPADVIFELSVRRDGKNLRTLRSRPLAGLTPTVAWPTDKVGRVSFLVRDGGEIALDLTAQVGKATVFGPVTVAELDEGEPRAP